MKSLTTVTFGVRIVLLAAPPIVPVFSGMISWGIRREEQFLSMHVPYSDNIKNRMVRIVFGMISYVSPLPHDEQSEDSHRQVR